LYNYQIKNLEDPMTIVLDGSNLAIDKLVRIARHGEKVELHPAALDRIKVCREMLEEKLNARDHVRNQYRHWRVLEIILSDEQVNTQRHDLQSRSRYGDPAPIEYVGAQC
jgi:histidine ammonia-lyase